MSKLKTLSLLLLLVSITGIMVGSGGFTALSADRGVSIGVENDESAYIGYESNDLTVKNGTTIDLVYITNRLPDSIDVTDITIKDGDFTISELTTPTDISPGERGTIQGTVVCTPSENQAIKLSVTVSGSDITAQLTGDTTTRNFMIMCASEKEDGEGKDGDGGEE
jgi:type 1 fimbria pilin